MKLPHLLSLGLVGVAILGCGGSGSRSPQNWSVDFQPSQGVLTDYSLIITRNDRDVSSVSRSDECWSDGSSVPDWCSIPGGSTIDFRVAPSETPYRIHIRRIRGTGTAFNSRLGVQRNNDAFQDAEVDVPTDRDLPVWRVFLDNAELLNGGSRSVGRTKASTLKAGEPGFGKPK